LKIVVIGANGQLGSELCDQLVKKHQVIGLTHADIEITDIDNVSKVLKELRPGVILNTAAYHNLPDCEKYPEKLFQVNGIGAFHLAQIADDLGSVLVHYSTDYVFDGNKKAPYVESDQPNPLNIYALTKLNGESLIKNYCKKYFILRISGIYGKTVCRAKGKNFITTMQKAAKENEVVKVVDDEILTPTSVHEIAKNTNVLMDTEAYGLYHMTCEGYCSWFEFASIIFKELGIKTPLISCKSNEFPMTIKRPAYSVLENQNLKTVNLNQMVHWKDALISFLKSESMDV
jgi:dTDP-4-dehydrorhamnose reductase